MLFSGSSVSQIEFPYKSNYDYWDNSYLSEANFHTEEEEKKKFHPIASV